jgi:hypothetical protein
MPLLSAFHPKVCFNSCVLIMSLSIHIAASELHVSLNPKLYIFICIYVP